MFGKEFYPTPEHLIKKMLQSYKNKDGGRWSGEYSKLSGLTILEPSAGKGDILNFISDKISRYGDANIHAIEIEPELQAVLRDKGYDVVSSDFLNYNESYYYDLIIMNPPFSNGDEHLLHAISLAKNTRIICLLNAETIRNPYSKTRKLLLNKIEDHGSYEYLESEFTDAERKTNVEVALVTLDFEDDNDMFDFNFKDKEEVELDFNFDFVNNDVARQDLIGNLNIRYEEVRKVYVDYLHAEEKYHHFKNLFLNGESFHIEGTFEKDDGTPQQKYNYISQKMKIFMWRKVISELDVKKYMSHKVASNFEAFVKQQSKMAFTKENVALFFQTIMNNRINIWNEAVIDVFDMLTSYYSDNRNYVEGWKTNEKYKINRKVILPNWCEWGSPYDTADYRKSYGAKFGVSYTDREKYADIDKVIAYIAGHTLLPFHTIHYALDQKFDQLGKVYPGDKFDNRCESAYFNIKFFKKGTVHLEFKDKKIWDLFNMTACAGKNWLPGDEKAAWEQKQQQKHREEEEKEIKQLVESTEKLTQTSLF